MARERKFSQSELYQSTKELLLTHGYEAFTFSLLAEKLNVSRGTIYKYFDKKEELIFDYMISEMDHFLQKLQDIKDYPDFDAQFDYLLELIFSRPEIPHLILIGQQLSVHENQRAKEKKEHLDCLRLDMYRHLQDFIKLGRENQHLKPQIPDGLVLGFIFQSIAIPNHFGVPSREWVNSIKEVIRNGMFSEGQ